MYKSDGTTPTDTSQYLQNLQLVSKAAHDNGLPFTNIVQGGVLAGQNPPWRCPNSNELRYLVYSTLAYGAQGISYFRYSGMSEGGLQPNADGTPTAVYTALTPLNHQFVNIAKQTQSLKWIGTYLKGYRTSVSGVPWAAGNHDLAQRLAVQHQQRVEQHDL